MWGGLLEDNTPIPNPIGPLGRGGVGGVGAGSRSLDRSPLSVLHKDIRSGSSVGKKLRLIVPRL